MLLSNLAQGQDAGLSAHTSPIDGCDKAASEMVTIVIINNSTAPFIPGGQITANYTIDGGAVVQELVSAQINVGSTFNFTFFQKADLSTCNQDYEIKVWIDYGADTNPNNDTLTWTVRNDCTIIPGQVVNDELVCYGDNSNTLSLVSWSNGTISNWVYSEDNGATWTQIANTGTTHTFNDLTVDTQFAVEIEGGFCNNDRSDVATITIQPNPIAGTITGPDTLCISSANGTLTLSGNSASILDWEYSEDNGGTWISTGNTSTTETFTGLTQTVLYRALIDGGVCANIYSNEFQVAIAQLSDGGVLSQDETICEGNDANLSLNAYVGDIQNWQFSSDGVVWNDVSPINTADTYNTGSLSASTYYRVRVKNSVCDIAFSNEVLITVEPFVNAGTISGSDSLCITNATGVLTLSGNSGSVINWESSTDDGLNWSTIANITTTENYTSLSTTTWYRALIDGGACPDAYSDTAFIVISQSSDAGNLLSDTIVCEGESVNLQLINNIGSVIDWEESLNGTVWTSLNNTTNSYLIPSVTVAKSYRVIVKSGVCDEDTSNLVLVDKFNLPIVDAGLDQTILDGDTIQLDGSGGLIGVWTPGTNLSDSTVYNPLAYPNTTTTYTLTAISADGCINSDEVVITVNPGIPPIDVKNLITPNNDGANDTWIIIGMEAYPNVAVKVYNIYGMLVYENENYANDWSGDYKNKELPSGVYWYFVELGGTDDVLKGNLTILKDE